MYRVRGGDGLEYGPISQELVSQWIRERRLDRSSPARRDDQTPWQTLGDFPEFGEVLRSVTSPPVMAVRSPEPYDDERARLEAAEQVRLPALLLAIYGGLILFNHVVASLVNWGRADFSQSFTATGDIPPQVVKAIEAWMSMPRPIFVTEHILGILVAVTIVWGGLEMGRLRSRNLCLTAGILTALPCFGGCCCCLGLPLGVWVLSVLSRSSVSRHFR